MKIRNWFRRGKKETGPEPHALPKPVQVRLSDVSTHTGSFSRISEWDTYQPLPINGEIPNLVTQLQEIDMRIREHAGRGTLDGLVPDLLDREINQRCAEIKARIDAAHERNLRQLAELREQAKLAQTELTVRLNERQNTWRCAEAEYRKAWQELTGEAPPTSELEPARVTPILLQTSVAADDPRTRVEFAQFSDHQGGGRPANSVDGYDATIFPINR